MTETTITFDSTIILEFVVCPLIVAGALGLYAYFKRKFRCVDEIQDRTLRQSHAMIASAYRQDEITTALHPDSPTKSNLGPLMEGLLKDGKGNL